VPEKWCYEGSSDEERSSYAITEIVEREFAICHFYAPF
jgi:hypothetical protein